MTNQFNNIIKTVLFIALMVCFAFTPIGFSYQALPVNNQFETYRASASDMEKEWSQFTLESHQRWSDFKVLVENKWNEAVYSTRKEWVSYDEKNDTRSRVDFKDGQVTIETLVQVNLKEKNQTIKTRLLTQLKTILNKTIDQNDAVLKDQLETKTRKAISKENIEELFAKEIVSGIEKQSNLIQSKDGVKRQKYTVSIQMVPDHLHIRAKKYVVQVQQMAHKFSLRPELIMAVIHTESYFNPLAASGKGAIGLMQVVPKWAGKEAYEYVYGDTFNIDPDFLYSPGINLELGSAYLHLLMTRYYSWANDVQKIKQLSICAYNWGPTAVNKKIIAGYDIKKMSRARLYDLLVAKTPDETSQYLKKVLSREQIYKPYFQ